MHRVKLSFVFFARRFVIELRRQHRAIELDQRGMELQRRKFRMEETSGREKREYRTTLKHEILIRAAVRRVNASRFRISDAFYRCSHALSILSALESPNYVFVFSALSEFIVPD